METGKSCRIRGRVYPLASPVSDKGRRGRAGQKMGRHYIVPRLVDRMRTVTHVERVTEPRAVPVQMQPRTIQITPSTCTVIAVLLILISGA